MPIGPSCPTPDHPLLQLGHHSPWLGKSCAITPGVLCTPSVLAGKQSSKVNQPPACGLFLFYQACCLMERPHADSYKYHHHHYILFKTSITEIILHKSEGGTSLLLKIVQTVIGQAFIPSQSKFAQF